MYSRLFESADQIGTTAPFAAGDWVDRPVLVEYSQS